MSYISLFDICWDRTTAGPSPDHNKRTEIFFAGCHKAFSGHPCPGCFNPKLWDQSCGRRVTPQDIVNRVVRFANNKYVTICGGEPTDQMEGLIELCRLLKQHGFHILVYTWKQYEDLYHAKDSRRLFSYIDMMIDGVYDETKRSYIDNGSDGIHSSIGSDNQRLVVIPKRTNSTAFNLCDGNIISYPVSTIHHIQFGTDSDESMDIIVK